jgi:hypothetical protein
MRLSTLSFSEENHHKNHKEINDMDVENLLRKQDGMLKGQYNVRDDARRLCVDGYRQLDPCLAMAS